MRTSVRERVSAPQASCTTVCGSRIDRATHTQNVAQYYADNLNHPTKAATIMSDWDFLHEMHDRGYSPEEIADAAGSGAAPWEWEYLSREWIDSELDGAPQGDLQSVDRSSPFQSEEGFPFSINEQTEIFKTLVDCASRHFQNTGRYLQVWGELGEIFAELKFGLRRHGTHWAGSDGTIDGKLVEVKTISPEKNSDQVLVKSQGDFEKLLIVRIDHHFHFRAKLFDRSELLGGSGKFLKGRFKDADDD